VALIKDYYTPIKFFLKKGLSLEINLMGIGGNEWRYEKLSIAD
jgi:hypothetical protein